MEDVMIKEFLWAKHQDKDIFQYHLTNGQYKAVISNYGALLTHLYAPDKNGNMADIVLGFDDFEDYLTLSPYFGATIGRFGNRIKDAKFTLNDTIYQLTKNEGENQLHGGFYGFDKQIWDVQLDNKNTSIELTYVSPDGEEGFPGNLTTKVTYQLKEDGSLIYKVEATSDKDTICSIVNHSYFNLAGSGDTLKHRLWVDADAYTEVDDTLIPTGKLLSTGGTGLDFSSPRLLGEAMKQMNSHVYDHNLALNGNIGSLRKVAILSDDVSKRSLEVSTTLPGLQIYNSAVMQGANIKSKDGTTYPNFAGFCLETQYFPDSPNISSFAQPILKAGELWQHCTIFKLGC